MNTVGNTANMMAQAKLKAAQAQKAQREGQTAKAKVQSQLQAKNQEVKNLAPKMMPNTPQSKLNMMG